MIHILSILIQQGQSLVVVLIPATQGTQSLEQSTIKQEYRGRGREREGGKKWKEGETIHRIVFAGTWSDQFGLDCRKVEAKRRQRDKWQPVRWSDLDRRGHLNAQGLESHPHTHVAMLKKKKDGESSEPCVKKVRIRGRGWISLTSQWFVGRWWSVSPAKEANGTLFCFGFEQFPHEEMVSLLVSVTFSWLSCSLRSVMSVPALIDVDAPVCIIASVRDLRNGQEITGLRDKAGYRNVGKGLYCSWLHLLM